MNFDFINQLQDIFDPVTIGISFFFLFLSGLTFCIGSTWVEVHGKFARFFLFCILGFFTAQQFMLAEASFSLKTFLLILKYNPYYSLIVGFTLPAFIPTFDVWYYFKRFIFFILKIPFLPFLPIIYFFKSRSNNTSYRNEKARRKHELRMLREQQKHQREMQRLKIKEARYQARDERRYKRQEYRENKFIQGTIAIIVTIIATSVKVIIMIPRKAIAMLPQRTKIDMAYMIEDTKEVQYKMITEEKKAIESRYTPNERGFIQRIADKFPAWRK